MLKSMADKRERPLNFRAVDSSELTEVGLLRRAQPLADAFRGRLPLIREIDDINEHFGVEVAQTVFTLALDQIPAYSEFIRQVRGFDLRALDLAKRADASRYEVTIVTSAFDIRGEDVEKRIELWRSWARSLGFTTDVIHTDPNAELRENAMTISRHLFSNPHPRRILITYGPGAAEFRLLLGMRAGVAAELASVAYWINLAGAYSGAGWARLRNESPLGKLKLELSKFLGRSTPAAKVRRSRQLDPRLSIWRATVPIPATMQVINLIGLPVRSQVPASLMTSYHSLASLGPNDGAVGLFESIAHPGLIVPINGMSHAVEATRLEPFFKRVLGLIALDASSPKFPDHITVEKEGNRPLNPDRRRAMSEGINASGDRSENAELVQAYAIWNDNRN